MYKILLFFTVSLIYGLIVETAVNPRLNYIYIALSMLSFMKLNIECIPCFMRQALKALKFCGTSEEIQETGLREVMQALLREEWNRTPPELAHIVHAIVRKYCGDPYKNIKKKSNELALKLYPEIKSTVESSIDKLRTAVKVSIAGNIVDFGAIDKDSVEEFNLMNFVREVVKSELDIDDYGLFRQKLEESKSLLYFADNAGEIVFDRILIETMLSVRKLKVMFVVKAGPIINDATLEDAKQVGLDEIVSEYRFISNGEVGVERNSPEVGRWIEEHDLTVSKGQGNYEGLSEFSGIFYMLMVKCPVIARHIGVKVGSKVLLYK